MGPDCLVSLCSTVSCVSAGAMYGRFFFGACGAVLESSVMAGLHRKPSGNRDGMFKRQTAVLIKPRQFEHANTLFTRAKSYVMVHSARMGTRFSAPLQHDQVAARLAESPLLPAACQGPDRVVSVWLLTPDLAPEAPP